MKIKPVSRKQNIVVQELESELLVYDLQTNKAFCMNETSAFIFQFCDGRKTVTEIADLMSVKLKTLVSEDYVRLTLHELKRNGLLENANEIKTYLNGINRREIIKKVGLATLIALPIVSSVVAPSAAMAASGGTVALLGACISSPECVSGNCVANQCCSSISVGNNAPNTVIGIQINLTDIVSCGAITQASQDSVCNDRVGNLCCSGTAVVNFCGPGGRFGGIGLTCKCG